MKVETMFPLLHIMVTKKEANIDKVNKKTTDKGRYKYLQCNHPPHVKSAVIHYTVNRDMVI